MPIENSLHSDSMVRIVSRERFQGLDHFDMNEFIDFLNQLVVPAKLQDLFDLLETLKENRFSVLLKALREFLTYQLNHGSFTPHIKNYFSEIIDIEFPVDIKSSYPKPVADILELLNAMWHGEQALEFLETKEISNKVLNHSYNMVFSRYGLQPISLILQRLGNAIGLWKNNDDALPNLPDNQVLLKIYYDVAHHIYKAFWSITHLNVKNTLNLIFEEELKEYFIPLMQIISEKVEVYLQKTGDFFKEADYLDWAYSTGRVTGIAVDQLKPHTGKIDVQYLVNFTQILPSYITKLTEYIENLKQTFANQQPFVDQKKLEEFEENSIDLLHSLEHIQKGVSVFSVIHYIRVINHTVNIVKQLISEVGKTRESTQELIKLYLAQLKYKFIPNLFSFMDKIEKTGLIAKGTITTPLFAKVNELYNKLIELCKNVVDFEDESLCYLADTKFMEIRFHQLYKQMTRNIQHSLSNSDVKNIAESFFENLQLHANRKYFHSLPTEIRLQLSNNLKILKPLFCELDMPLYSQMVRILTNQDVDRLEITRVLQIEENVKNLLQQKLSTYEFDFDLCEDIIDNAYQTIDFDIRPLENTPIYARPQVRTLIGNPNDSLLENEVLGIESLQLQRGKKSIENLITIIRNGGNAREIKSLYAQIQPLIINLQINNELIIKDEAIVNLINQPEVVNSSMDDIIKFLEFLHSYFEERINSIDDELQIHAHWNSRYCFTLPLELPAEDSRAYYVFKTQEYSETLTKTRRSLDELTTIFNSYLAHHLSTVKNNELPFPELREVETRLREPTQIVTIKNLSNLCYQVYKATVRLEDLRDDDEKTHYVWNVMKTFAHFNQALQYTKNLFNDPMLQQLLKEVTINIENLQALFFDEMELYQQKDVTENVALNFALSVLKIFPKRLKALNNEDVLDAKIIKHDQNRAKVMTNRIGDIINASNSYFRLFLAVPKMYLLFVELRSAVMDLANVTNSVVKQRLWYIKNNILGKMQALADYYEYTLGLRSGILSNPLNDICFEYFAGLLEPLGLNSKDFLELSVSLSVLDERLVKVVEAQAKESIHYWSLEKKSEQVKNFLQLITYFKSKRSLWSKIVEWSNYVYNPVITTDTSDPFDDLNRIYEQIVNMLHANDNYDLVNFYQHYFNIRLDEIIQEQDPRKKLKFLERFAKLYSAYYDGLLNTSFVTIKSLEEKRLHLDSERKLEISRGNIFIKDYIKEIINGQFNRYVDELIHLKTSKEQYTKELFAYIEENSDVIIDNVCDEEDIIHAVNENLSQLIDQFNKNNNFLKLEKIRLAISDFDAYLIRHSLQNYLSKNSLYEDTKTLHNKINVIEELKKIAFDDKKSVELCLSEIEQYVKEPQFQATMLSQREDNFGFLQAIARFVLRICELIGFYTPEHKKYYNEIQNSVESIETTKSVRAQFSMFKQTRGYGLPTEESLFDFHSDDSSEGTLDSLNEQCVY